MHLRERVAGIITLVLAGGLMVQALLYVHRRLEPAGAVHCTDQCPEHHRLLVVLPPPRPPPSLPPVSPVVPVVPVVPLVATVLQDYGLD